MEEDEEAEHDEHQDEQHSRITADILPIVQGQQQYLNDEKQLDCELESVRVNAYRNGIVLMDNSFEESDERNDEREPNENLSHDAVGAEQDESRLDKVRNEPTRGTT